MDTKRSQVNMGPAPGDNFSHQLSGEVQKPHKPSNIQRRLNIKGRTAPKHSLQFVLDGARGAQGNQVAGKNKAAVAVRGAGTDCIPVKEANIFPGLRQVVGTGQPDNTAADHQNIAVFFH